MTRSSKPSARHARPEGGLRLTVLADTLAICRLDADARIPRWARQSDFLTISRTPEELSVVCIDEDAPESVRCQRGWRAIRVVGTLDLSLIGVLAALAGPLADARIGVFSISTFDTDYLLVRAARLDDAIAVLENAGHVFERATAAVGRTRDEEAAPAADDAESEPPRRRSKASSRRQRDDEPPAKANRTRRAARPKVDEGAQTADATDEVPPAAPKRAVRRRSAGSAATRTERSRTSSEAERKVSDTAQRPEREPRKRRPSRAKTPPTQEPAAGSGETDEAPRRKRTSRRQTANPATVRETKPTPTAAADTALDGSAPTAEQEPTSEKQAREKTRRAKTRRSKASSARSQAPQATSA
ncbi:MAG: ACT domain-containing protein, partial [Acidobacteriota bacterium]